MGNKLGFMVDQPIHIPDIPSDDLIIPHAKVGIEYEFEGWDGHQPHTYWEKQHDDGSLREGGCEQVTRGGIVGSGIRKAVEEICALAKTRKWKTGVPRASIHIHLDVTDLDVDKRELAVLVCNYMLVEHILFAYAGDWRRSTGYAVAIEDGQIDFKAIGDLLFRLLSKEEFQRVAKNLSKYQALNLNPLVRFGTIEFRHMPTTWDVERVMDWINMILAIKKSSTDERFKEPLKTLSALGPEKYCAEVFGKIWPKISHLLAPHRVWNAVDNAMAIMAMGGAVKSNKIDWQDRNEISPLLQEKLAKTTDKNVKKAIDPAFRRERFM